jgi:hypothetical protein
MNSNQAAHSSGGARVPGNSKGNAVETVPQATSINCDFDALAMPKHA